MFRKVAAPEYRRERIDTRDGDFLDLDWIKNNASTLVILSHGLEGSSRRPYILGAAEIFSRMNWDVLAWNCRSCSGEMNRLPRLYHHGASEDLEDVILHAAKGGYKRIFLGGFSLGGSLTVKYLGDHDVHDAVVAGFVVSVPFSILGSVSQLRKRGNSFYRKRFIKKLKSKIQQKALQFPDKISTDGLEEMQHFEPMDEAYTAPLHGFKSARDFYEKASAIRYLPKVRHRLMIVNALNDPFLADNCYPKEIAASSTNIVLEMPRMGGHVGFLLDKDRSWIDQRMADFFAEQ